MTSHLPSLNMREFPAAAAASAATETALTIHALGDADKTEALDFLAARPLHTIFMAGFLRDNGVVSPLNRGTFYGCRAADGRLEGVALIGHATLVEARSDLALAAFARLAQECPLAHLILGEEDKVERFWDYFSENGQTARRVCRELLLELRWPVELREPVAGLRLANEKDMELLLPVNASMVFAESGVNPLDVDPVGFSRRWLRRIEQRRVWVWTEDSRLIFKTDIICETPDVIYLEGVYVNPEERGKGYGLRALSQMNRILLEHTGSLCLLVNENNLAAQSLYSAAGYKMRARYDTIFLHRKN